jgi:hypothetical protein
MVDLICAVDLLIVVGRPFALSLGYFSLFAVRAGCCHRSLTCRHPLVTAYPITATLPIHLVVKTSEVAEESRDGGEKQSP